MLDLPAILQRTDWSCGQVAARVVFQFHGFRGRTPQGSPIDGTDPRTLETAFRRAGLRVQSGEMEPDDLRHHTRAGRPVVCLVTEDDGVGHYVVVAGVKGRTVFYHCPTAGAKSELLTRFAARWHDSDRVAVRYERWGIAVWPG
jgi:ABC-type bacteriocin/lantibiotic exporter with double-glycine peptidase domain